MVTTSVPDAIFLEADIQVVVLHLFGGQSLGYRFHNDQEVYIKQQLRARKWSLDADYADRFPSEADVNDVCRYIRPDYFPEAEKLLV